MFDPLNPEDFQPLSLRETYELRDTDSAAHNEYGIQKQAWENWKAANLQRLQQLPNPVLQATDQYSDRRERKEIELMTKLGHAIKDEGFEVKWMTGMYKGDYEVHPTWAKYGLIFKDGQRVGDFRPWRPSSGYTYTPVGWIIRTNRGVGNPNARSSFSREEKHLKKLESAIKYIKETAVPKIDVEADIKKVQMELQTIRVQIGNLNSEIQRAKDGMETYRSPDGLMQKLLGARQAHDADKIWELLGERLELIGRLKSQRNALMGADEAKQEQLDKLVEQAKEVLPEFYP
jgi:hypothetical protein